MTDATVLNRAADWFYAIGCRAGALAAATDDTDEQVRHHATWALCERLDIVLAGIADLLDPGPRWTIQQLNAGKSTPVLA